MMNSMIGCYSPCGPGRPVPSNSPYQPNPFTSPFTPNGGMSPVNPALPAGPNNPVIVQTAGGPVAVDPTSGTATALNPAGLSPSLPSGGGGGFSSAPFMPGIPGLTPGYLGYGGLRGGLRGGGFPVVNGAYPLARFGAADTTVTTPSLFDRTKEWLNAQNATVNVKNGYLVAGAAAIGFVAYEMMGKKGKRR